MPVATAIEEAPEPVPPPSLEAKVMDAGGAATPAGAEGKSVEAAAHNFISALGERGSKKRARVQKKPSVGDDAPSVGVDTYGCGKCRHSNSGCCFCNPEKRKAYQEKKKKRMMEASAERVHCSKKGSEDHA